MSLPFPSRFYVTTLIILGVLTPICLSPIGAYLALFCAMTFVGLPVAFILAAIPTIFLFMLLAGFAYQVMLIIGIRSRLLAAALAMLPLTVVPWIENRRLDAIAVSLTDGDRNEIPASPNLGTLAFLTESGSAGRTCHDLCKVLLLNGAADAVIVTQVKSDVGEFGETLSGTAYRLEKREVCPPEIRKSEDTRTPASRLLRLRAVQGVCLEKSPATLAQADAVIASGGIIQGESAFTAGLSPFADTISANRLSFYTRDDGVLVERYRATGVTYFRLLPILAPSFVGGYGLEIAAGFLRKQVFLGDAARYRKGPELSSFLAEMLHLDLLPREADDELVRGIIVEALDQPGMIDPNRLAVMADFVQEAAGHDISDTDSALAIRILRDSRIPVSPDTARAIRRLKPGDARLTAQYAEALFTRLGMVRPDAEGDSGLENLGRAIEALPGDTILPYRDDLERLARDRQARVKAYPALKQLSVFGADAIPTLLYLIDDAATQKDPVKVVDAWQHPYTAGIQGLCLIGNAGAAAIPKIYQRLESGIIEKFSIYSALNVETLVSLGADPEAMWPHLSTDERGNTRELFDKRVANARRDQHCRD